MERLHTLLHGMDRKQVKVLKKYLTCFSTRNENEAKTWDLAKLILASEKRIPTLDECSQKIYNAPTDSRIEKLKNRLFTKVLDSFLIDINVDRRDVYDVKNHMMVKVMKKAALFQALRVSGVHRTIISQVLDEIVAIAKKYEIYSVLVDHLKLSKGMAGWKMGFKEFDRINKEIAKYSNCENAVNKAMDYYYQLLMNSEFQGSQDKKHVQGFLREAIADLKKDYDVTESAVVGHYLKLLEIAYFQNENDYQVARDVCLELLSIVNNNVSVYRRSRVGICYDNIAECDVYLGEYKTAISNARSAQQHFKFKSSDYVTSRQFEFYPCFYSGDITAAEMICRELSEITAKQQGDFRVAKYAYFNACVQFKLGNFKECLMTVSMKYELSKDKLGWELAIRMLRIMTLIEMKKFDEAQPLVGGLIKHIERNARKSDVHERDKMLARLFSEIEKEGFRFTKPGRNIVEMLRFLSEPDTSVSWKPMSPELIPVHEWVAERYGISVPSVHQVKSKSAKEVLASSER